MKKQTFLFGHTSQETALEVKDYPWGFRLRTSIFYWMETDPKRGDRFCSQTIDPKTGRRCAPKKSTYYNIGVMFRNEENGHISWVQISNYANQEEIKKFAEAVGEQNLSPNQIKQLRQMRGEKVVEIDEFTGEAKKDFKIQWTGDYGARLIFDRPDGVSVKEIFEALKSLDQAKLTKALEDTDSKSFGKQEGFIRVCVRKGIQLTTVQRSAYEEYLASDYSQVEA